MIESKYQIEIMTILGMVNVSFQETAWDEPADTSITPWNEGAEKVFRWFVRDFGVGVTGVRINPDHCSPVDLVRALEINDSYNKDRSISEWRVLSGYVPGVNDDIYDPFKNIREEFFPDEMILESSDFDDEANKAATYIETAKTFQEVKKVFIDRFRLDESLASRYWLEYQESINPEGLFLSMNPKEMRKIAKSFFNKILKKITVNRDDLGEILFTRRGMNKMLSSSADIEKLRILPKLHSLIKTGEIVHREKPLKKEKRRFIEWYYRIGNDVIIDGVSTPVHILVEKRKDGSIYYNHSLTEVEKRENPVVSHRGSDNAEADLADTENSLINDKIAQQKMNDKRKNIFESSDLDDEANKAATSPENDLPEPTEGQKKSGGYKKGHPRIAGLEIAIENPAGSERSGTDPGGKKWSIKMVDHYGYVKGSIGYDKDHVDVFINPGMDVADIAEMPVFVVDQINADGSFDEHKCMMGYVTKKEASKAYLANYEKGWTGLGAITKMDMDDFKIWVMDKKETKKPLVLESAYRDSYGDYGCLLAELPEAESMVIRNFAYSLPENDLAKHPDTGEPWVEHKSHITIRYGLLPTDTKSVENMVKGVSNIRGVYGKLGVFPGKNHDVLIIKAHSTDLFQLHHESSRQLPCIEAEYQYSPHVTIAYLNKAAGAKYEGMSFFAGVRFSFDQVTYSDQNGNSFPIKL